MSGASDIRSRISSTKKTEKITRAMEKVAASKIPKTQRKMRESAPYSAKIYDVIRHIARASSEYRHPFLIPREVKHVGLIIVTTDRGLCGGLNINLLREAISLIKSFASDGKEVSLAIVGRKGQAFFKRLGGNVLASVDHLGETPSVRDITGLVKVMLDAFYEGQIDALYSVHNEFVNTMTQTPIARPLLPLPISDEDEKSLSHRWDYIYEPDSRELLDSLLERYIEVQVYQAVIENIASEQASRMMAMKNATENAGDLIREFQLAYNKARQAAITQELAEIVGGAAAT